MLCLRSSHSASSTSCTLRSSVRSGLRNRFLASCWVSVEPPCEKRPRVRLLKTARVEPDRVDADMRIEAAVLDGDDGHRNIGRHLVQADGFAAGHAAIGDQLAVDRDDLDVGRPVGNRPVGDARHARAVVDDDAGGGDAAPDGEHEAPVEKPARRRQKTRGRDRRRGFRGAALGDFLLPPAGLRLDGTTRSSSPTEKPDGSRPRAGPSKVGSMRVNFPRCAMQSRIRPR